MRSAARACSRPRAGRTIRRSASPRTKKGVVQRTASRWSPDPEEMAPNRKMARMEPTLYSSPCPENWDRPVLLR